jgi:hypothetical protein
VWATHLRIRGVFALSAALLFATGAYGVLQNNHKIAIDQSLELSYHRAEESTWPNPNRT